MINKYIDIVTEKIDLLRKDENIEKAGKAISQTYISGGMLYVFGTGHSHLLGLELFYRAGGMVKVFPILSDEIMLHVGAVKSSEIERVSGYAYYLLKDYDIKSGDTIIIFSNSGINSVPIEMAMLCKEKGATVVAITNFKQSKASLSRASSNLKLFEVADIAIDNQGEIGDACIELATGQKIAPTSTVLGAAICNLIEIATVKAMLEKGENPELFLSANMPDGDKTNAAYIEKYKDIIKSL